MAFSSTLIIIIVVIAVVILLASLLVSYILWSKSKRKVPLPPVQPLAHDRERSFHALAAEKERERSMILQIEIAPSWSELGAIKSTVSSESSSTANTVTYPVPPGISSKNRHAPPRPLSLASSVHTSRSNLSRAIPHAPNSNVQIVLPAPLGASTVDYSRNSVADRWASHAVNDSQPIRSRSRPRAQSLSKSHSRSSLNQSYDYSRPNPSPPDTSARHRARTNSLPYSTTYSYQVSVPPIPSQYPSSVDVILPPPVPRIPSVYGQLKSTASVSTSSYPDPDSAEFPPRRRSRSRGPTHNQSFHNSDWVQEGLASQMDRQTGRPRERSRHRSPGL
ncbi:hypothetical protein C8J55DRAFT_505235 [Lentinula edodes]|uniref:Uncharacterized protein n=1 Tax=Lentinula lateritia TaxID=40482 RepID=A0A9W9ATX8_9AGAR|nr:hypothetical protein C8J55DRAFT_505235 [Lentinula edodes]